jgi:hypothetical protein
MKTSSAIVQPFPQHDVKPEIEEVGPQRLRRLRSLPRAMRINPKMVRRYKKALKLRHIEARRIAVADVGEDGDTRYVLTGLDMAEALHQLHWPVDVVVYQVKDVHEAWALACRMFAEGRDV